MDAWFYAVAWGTNVYALWRRWWKPTKKKRIRITTHYVCNVAPHTRNYKHCQITFIRCNGSIIPFVFTFSGGGREIAGYDGRGCTAAVLVVVVVVCIFWLCLSGGVHRFCRNARYEQHTFTVMFRKFSVKAQFNVGCRSFHSVFCCIWLLADFKYTNTIIKVRRRKKQPQKRVRSNGTIVHQTDRRCGGNTFEAVKPHALLTSRAPVCAFLVRIFFVRRIRKCGEDAREPFSQTANCVFWQSNQPDSPTTPTRWASLPACHVHTNAQSNAT